MTDSKATDMAGDSAILRELGQINNELGQIKTDVGQLKNDVGQLKTDVGQLKNDVGQLKTDVDQIKTWQKALTAGLGIVIAIALFLHREQNARNKEQNDRITRVEERIVSRLETVFANQPTTACQCEKEN